MSIKKTRYWADIYPSGYETDLSTKNYPTMRVGKEYAVVLMPLIHCCDFDIIHSL